MRNWLTWKFGYKTHFIYVLYKLYTEGIKYCMLKGTYFVLVESIPGKYRKAVLLF